MKVFVAFAYVLHKQQVALFLRVQIVAEFIRQFFVML
jgi:hypothetical protein